MIKEFETAEDAKKLEETVKTGYVETTIETLANWIAVEEDLTDSYRSLAARPENAAWRWVFLQLAQDSRENMNTLFELRRSFEGLDTERTYRISLLASLKPQVLRA
jgi:rubrerythrin